MVVNLCYSIMCSPRIFLLPSSCCIGIRVWWSLRERHRRIVSIVWSADCVELIFSVALRVIAMDRDRGLLLAWLSLVYVRRNAKNFNDTLKLDLPDLPHLSKLLAKSWAYDWTEDCYHEVVKFGKAAGFPLSAFLEELKLPCNSFGSCSGNPITLDTTSEELVTSSSELGSMMAQPGTPLRDAAVVAGVERPSPIMEEEVMADAESPPVPGVGAGGDMIIAPQVLAALDPFDPIPASVNPSVIAGSAESGAAASGASVLPVPVDSASEVCCCDNDAGEGLAPGEV